MVRLFEAALQSSGYNRMKSDFCLEYSISFIVMYYARPPTFLMQVDDVMLTMLQDISSMVSIATIESFQMV